MSDYLWIINIACILVILWTWPEHPDPVEVFFGGVGLAFSLLSILLRFVW